MKKYLSLFIFSWFLINLHACVVKEDLKDFEKIYTGLNFWQLKLNQNQEWQLDFNLGYLIGLKDETGIDQIRWEYQLINLRKNQLFLKEEEMRPADLKRTQIFVNGTRSRKEVIAFPLQTGDQYVLWFKFTYRSQVIHEVLYELKAGEKGENRDWVNEILENVDVDNIRTLEGFDQGTLDQVIEGESNGSMDAGQTVDIILDMRVDPLPRDF